MRWTTLGRVFGGLLGILAGAGLLSVAIAYGLVVLAVGTRFIVLRRRERNAQTTATAEPAGGPRTHTIVTDRQEGSRSYALVIGALILGLVVGLIAHGLGLW